MKSTLLNSGRRSALVCMHVYCTYRMQNLCVLVPVIFIVVLCLPAGLAVFFF